MYSQPPRAELHTQIHLPAALTQANDTCWDQTDL